MSGLLEVGQHLALAFAGPVLPESKSLVLLLGDGYIAGYSLGSVFLPDAADLSSSVADRDARVEVWRRRWGLAVAFVLAMIWVVGNLENSSSYPVVPADHDLLSAGALLGIGGLVASLYAPLISGRLMRTSQEGQTQFDLEHRTGKYFERLFGVVLASVYVGVWLNPW